jgi:hypothetical protein
MTDSIIQLVTEIHKDVKDLDRKLTEHMTSETTELAEEIAKLMAAAFPIGDPDGHRKHHELVIKQAEARTAFWEKMRFEISRWGLLGFLGWGLVVMWKAFLEGSVK